MTIEALVLELSAIRRIHTWQEVGCVIGYAGCSLGFYALTPFFIKRYGATLFNLSLLPTIVYALAFALVVYHSHVTWLYLGGFVIVLLGLGLYSLSEPKVKKEESQEMLSNGECEDEQVNSL
jgi:drug/metabolite transporter (DMT)-like permease